MSFEALQSVVQLLWSPPYQWCVLSHIQLFVTPWTIAHQSPLSMEFSRQEYWYGLPFSSLGDLPNPGIEPESLAAPALAGEFLATVPPGKPIWNVGGKTKQKPPPPATQKMGPEATPVNYYSVALIPSGSVSVTCLHSLASDVFIQLSFNNLTLRHSSLACPAASLWFGRTIRTSTGCGKKGKSLEQKGKRGTKLTLRANGTKDLNTSECFLLHFPLWSPLVSSSFSKISFLHMVENRPSATPIVHIFLSKRD